MTEQRRNRDRSRSFFWPVILIGAGVFLLLDQTNPDLFAVSPWAVALRMWPLLLILIGLDLLFGRGGVLSGLLGVLLAFLLVGLVLALAINPGLMPGLQLEARLQETTSGQVQVPGEGVESASATIEADDAALEIGALDDASAVFAGDLRYYGTLDFSYDVDDAGEARIRLRTAGGGNTIWFDPSTWFNLGGEGERWSVLLDPVVPYTLAVNLDDGQADLNLDGLNMRDLTVEFDDGSVTARLPRQLRDGRFTLDDGTLTLTLPALERSLGVQVRLTIDDGTFNPGPLARVSGTDEQSTWESDGYDAAEVRVNLSVTLDDGTVTIR